MEVTSLREPKMADRVATVLRRMFIRGEITEGTMLPPESELMERFGVSRPTLREAFRVLESESLIQVQRGVRGGARVTRPRRETLARYAGLILEYEGVTVKDVYDARVTLEVPMVEQLAKDQNPKVIAELEQIVERESQLNPGGDAVDQLTDFHAA
ncbi:MAG: GntR family transcriptional regulator, partial [Mycobacterium sp.]